MSYYLFFYLANSHIGIIRMDNYKFEQEEVIEKIDKKYKNI